MGFRICLILIFFPVVSRAQYAVFPTPGLELGSIYVCNPFDCASFFNYSSRYTGKVTLCGQTWSELNPYGYFRAEGGKYFWYASCNEERLLYDFTKNAGDTVQVFDLEPLIVTAVGTYTLDDGSVRKKITLQSLPPFFPTVYTWVDGIGDIDHGFTRAKDFEGGMEQLVCMRDSTGVFYHNPSWPLNCDSLLCKIPVPNFEYTCSGQTYHFLNLSEYSDTYFWDFGDGATSTEKNPEHTYTTPGCYVVMLACRTDCLPQSYSTAKRLAANAPVYWKNASHQAPEPFLKMQFLDAQRGWALGQEHIWKTTNGGAQWDSVPYPGPLRPLVSLQFKDFEHGLVQIRKPGTPYYDEILWTNDGLHWTVQSIDDNPTITAIERVNDSVAVVAAHYLGAYVTKDRGQTWTNIYNIGGASLIWDFVSLGGDTLYLAGINQLLPPYNKSVFAKTYDAIHWEVVPFLDPDITGARLLYFSDAQHGWLSNGKAIYHTANTGESWELQTLTPVSVFYMEFADSLHGWACGFQTGMYGTDDGGQTWTQQSCNRTAETLGALTVVSAQTAYAISQDGLVEYTATPEAFSICGTSEVADPAAEASSAFEIYPNPAHDALTIRWVSAPEPGVRFVLYSAQGAAVLHWNPEITTSVSVAHLPAGFYFLTRISEKRGILCSKKWIVSR